MPGRRAVGQIETEAPPADLDDLVEMPLPSDANTFFLGGLFALALLTAAYVAGEIVLPLAFAITLNLLMQPALRLLHQIHVPKALAALFLILVVFATIAGLGAAISGPAGAWMAKLPEGIPRLHGGVEEGDGSTDGLADALLRASRIRNRATAQHVGLRCGGTRVIGPATRRRGREPLEAGHVT